MMLWYEAGRGEKLVEGEVVVLIDRGGVVRVLCRREEIQTIPFCSAKLDQGRQLQN